MIRQPLASYVLLADSNDMKSAKQTHKLCCLPLLFCGNGPAAASEVKNKETTTVLKIRMLNMKWVYSNDSVDDPALRYMLF